jgi:hypothetical protein
MGFERLALSRDALDVVWLADNFAAEGPASHALIDQGADTSARSRWRSDRHQPPPSFGTSRPLNGVSRNRRAGDTGMRGARNSRAALRGLAHRAGRIASYRRGVSRGRP